MSNNPYETTDTEEIIADDGKMVNPEEVKRQKYLDPYQAQKAIYLKRTYERDGIAKVNQDATFEARSQIVNVSGYGRAEYAPLVEATEELMEINNIVSFGNVVEQKFRDHRGDRWSFRGIEIIIQTKDGELYRRTCIGVEKAPGTGWEVQVNGGIRRDRTRFQMEDQMTPAVITPHMRDGVRPDIVLKRQPELATVYADNTRTVNTNDISKIHVIVPDEKNQFVRNALDRIT